MKHQLPVIVLTGGGSGGHITPLLSLARELKKTSPNVQVVYIGHKGDQFDTLKLSLRDFDFTSFINGGKFRRYHGESFLSHLVDIKTLALNVRDLFRVVGGVFASLRILRRVKPDVVFSKGGFVAVPVGVAARILNIPIVTHDSDVVAGLANRIVGRWAAVRTAGMHASGSNAVYVGIPLDARIKLVTPKLQKEFKEALNIPPNNPLLLIGGSGNGAQTINELVIKIAPTILKSNLALRIVHIAGTSHETVVKRKYAEVLDGPAQDRVTVLGFTNEFYKYSSAADLIVSRAGATSLAEFAVEAKACIIIPSPFLASGHQLKNAEELKTKDAAVILANDVAPDELSAVIGEMLADPARRHELGQNLNAQVQSGAAAKLAKILLDLAAHKEGA